MASKAARHSNDLGVRLIVAIPLSYCMCLHCLPAHFNPQLMDSYGAVIPTLS